MGMDERNFYLIYRREAETFFTNFLWVIGHLAIAEKRNYVPIVDFQNYPTKYSEADGFDGIRNAWEYYFEQPSGADLEAIRDVDPSRIIDSKGFFQTPYIDDQNFLPHEIAAGKERNTHHVERVQSLVRKFIKIKPHVTDKVEDFCKQHFNNNTVLGVHIRGTDMTSEPWNYMFPIWQVVAKAETLMNELGMTKIFVCSDEARTIEFFKMHFGDCCLYTDCNRSMGGKLPVMYDLQNGSLDVNRRHNRYYSGLEVLVDVLLLARCQAFLASRSSVSNAAIYLSTAQKSVHYLPPTVFQKARGFAAYWGHFIGCDTRMFGDDVDRSDVRRFVRTLKDDWVEELLSD
jgi:hypothetical protein